MCICFAWAGRGLFHVCVYLLLVGNFPLSSAEAVEGDEESYFCVVTVPKYDAETVTVLCTDIDSDVQGSLAIVWQSSTLPADARISVYVNQRSTHQLHRPNSSAYIPPLVFRGICRNEGSLWRKGDNTVEISLHSAGGEALCYCSRHFAVHMVPSNESDRVVATGASANHFKTLRNFLLNGLPGYSGRVVAYDLGLTPEQHDSIATLSRQRDGVELRRFPFAAHPFHVSQLQLYAWKAIIVHDLLQEHARVLWMDSGNLAHPGAVDAAFAFIDEHGFFGVAGSTLVGSKTHPDTLARFAAAAAAAARPFAIGGAFGFARASAALAAVAAPLRACAAEAACFAPRGSSLENHRQDQSVLSALVHLTQHPLVPFRGFGYNHDLDFALDLVSPRHAASYPCPPDPDAAGAAAAGDCVGAGGFGWEAVPVLWRLACHDAERCFRPAEGADAVCVPNMCWATAGVEVEVNGRRGHPRGEGLLELDSAHLERLVYLDRALGLPAGAAVFAPGANYLVLRLLDAAGEVAAEARADFAIGVPRYAGPDNPSHYPSHA